MNWPSYVLIFREPYESEYRTVPAISVYDLPEEDWVVHSISIKIFYLNKIGHSEK